MSDIRAFDRVDRRLGTTEAKEVPLMTTGTWVPTLVGSTIAGTFTYNAATAGTWTRIDNLVWLRGRVVLTAVTVAPTGNLSIRGLPFTAGSPAHHAPGQLTFTYWGLCALGGGANVYLAAWIQNGATKADLVVSQNAGGAAALLTGAVAGVQANTDLVFAGVMEL